MASMTPEILKKILFWRKECPVRVAKNNRSNEITKWEYSVNEIKKIIVWDNPVKSFLCLIGVNVIFWLLIYIKLKFYGLIFIVLLVISLNQLWNEYFQSSVTSNDPDSGRESVASSSSSSSDFRFMSVAELNRSLRNGLEMTRNACIRLKCFRQEQPGTFCVTTCISFLMLSFIGRTVSGVTLLYTLLMAVMTVPGALIHLVPSHLLNIFVQFIYSSQKDAENDQEEEDYLPDTNMETLELLRLAGDPQLSPRDDDESAKDLLLEQITSRTNDTTESSYSKLSFYPDSTMPSVDSNLDFFELDFNGDRYSNRKGDTDESDHSDINFQSKHFNGDSSEEEEFANGLRLKEAEETGVKDNLPILLNAASVGLNLLSTGANILTSAVKSPAPGQRLARNDRESSSDTDSFELISEEDI